MSHEAIGTLICVFGIPNIVIAIVYVFQHRLMWADYKKRHEINGDKEG